MNLKDVILRPTTTATKLKLAAVLIPASLLVLLGSLPFVVTSKVGEVAAIAGLCMVIGGLLSLSRYVTDKAEIKLKQTLHRGKRGQPQQPRGPAA